MKIRLLVPAFSMAASGLIGFSAMAADLSGIWTTGASRPISLTLQQSGSSFTGSYGNSDGSTLPIVNGKLSGSDVSFDVSAGNNTVQFAGQVDGANMTLHPMKDGKQQGGELKLIKK